MLVNWNPCICKPFVIPNQYPTLIVVGSDLTFSVSNPKKWLWHKIWVHLSKFRPFKSQCQWCGVSHYPNIRLPPNSYVEQGRHIKLTVSYIENAPIQHWIMEVGCQNTSAVHHTQYYPSINQNHQHTTFETFFTSITPPTRHCHHTITNLQQWRPIQIQRLLRDLPNVIVNWHMASAGTETTINGSQRQATIISINLTNVVNLCGLSAGT